KVCPGPIGLALLFASTAPSFFPVFLPLNGTPEAVLLAPPFLQIPVFPGTTACFEGKVQIPPDVALVGADFWLQGARMDIGPAGPMHLTNPICLTIAPPVPSCANPGC
ncbi:MAG TPA: hypothetical protein VKF62_13185, partial [Planctomycetota bacterium]|nr:hypothetical protein [Planctomycetota bacterium]